MSATQETLAQALARLARDQPDRVVLHYGNETWTYARLERAARRCALGYSAEQRAALKSTGAI